VLLGMPAQGDPDHPKVRTGQTAKAAAKGGSFTNGAGMRMIWVKPGRFLMGSPPGEVGRAPNEDQVEVELTTGFWLGETEVTVGQWEQLMGKREVRSGPKGAMLVMPAEAHAFCAALTNLERKTGRIPEGYRYQLPTEAQWEFACRAGTKGPHAGEVKAMAWLRGDLEYDRSVLSPVASVAKKLPNAWGFYDMHGNVDEWCSDWYDRKLQGGKDPAGPFLGKGDMGPWYVPAQRGRVLRGGSVNGGPASCRSAVRGHWVPTARWTRWGFRVALRPVGRKQLTCAGPGKARDRGSSTRLSRLG
jgi:formylglycine-generating enzyme required for sulfatase activity